jgi:hypothetical protein
MKHRVRRALLLGRTAPGYQLDNKNDYGYDKQRVDKSTESIGTHQAEQPQHEQHYYDGVKHKAPVQSCVTPLQAK